MAKRVFRPTMAQRLLVADKKPAEPGPKKPVTVSGKFCMTRDPRVYSDSLPAKQRRKRCLGLDLGTNCGVAFSDFAPGGRLVDTPIVIGQWDLSLGPWDSGPLRHIRLKQFLEIAQPDLIIYEEVKYDAQIRPGMGPGAIVARVASAAEFLGGLKATLAVWAEEQGIPAQGLPITVIKKFATQRGNANKTDMITAANERFGTSFDCENYEQTGVDNMADAAFCCLYGVTHYADGMS